MRIKASLVSATTLLAALSLGLPAHRALAEGGGRVDCAYAADPSNDPAPHEGCGSFVAGGKLRLTPSVLHDLSYDESGLASVIVGPLAYYVARDGRTAPVAEVDGHAAVFHEGLAPSPRRVGRGYKVGYIDQSLRLVIPASFDGALDFDSGRAQVCLGCRVARDGEWAELQGGAWGCIDHTGREVVPIRQPSPDDLDCSSAGR